MLYFTKVLFRNIFFENPATLAISELVLILRHLFWLQDYVGFIYIDYLVYTHIIIQYLLYVMYNMIMTACILCVQIYGPNVHKLH